MTPVATAITAKPELVATVLFSARFALFRAGSSGCCSSGTAGSVPEVWALARVTLMPDPDPMRPRAG